MTYIVRLREEAELDLEDAASWYESQRSGLGQDFLDTVLQSLELIGQNPSPDKGWERTPFEAGLVRPAVRLAVAAGFI